MIELAIHLKDGFMDDTVQILADSREVYNKKGVSTDWSIGLADIVRIQVPDKTIVIKIEVNVISKRTSGSTQLEVQRQPFLGVSIDNGGLSFTAQAEDFIMF